MKVWWKCGAREHSSGTRRTQVRCKNSWGFYMQSAAPGTTSWNLKRLFVANRKPGLGVMTRQYTAEGLGTAMLLAAVVGSGIMGERLSGGNVAIALLVNTIATGAALVAIIL